MTFDAVLYLILALFAFLLICVPSVLGYRASSASSAASRTVSFIGFLLLITGSLLASSCLLGDCLSLGVSKDMLAPYLWFFAPGALVSLLGWALALTATDRQKGNRRFLLLLLAPAATLVGVFIAGLLLGATGAGTWIASAAYLTPCLPLFVLLAVPKGDARGASAPQ